MTSIMDRVPASKVHRQAGRHSPLTETRHFDPPSADATATESSMQPKRLLAGLGWNTVGQFLVVGISLGLTPFLLHHLGPTQYGIFALVSSVRGLLSNLDGGLAPTGYRYFPVYVGRRGRCRHDQFPPHDAHLGGDHRRCRDDHDDSRRASRGGSLRTRVSVSPVIRMRPSNSSGS